MSTTHTNGSKKFLFVVLTRDINNDEDAHILRSDHEPSRDEAAKAAGMEDPDGWLVVIRVDEDSIITLPSLPHN